MDIILASKNKGKAKEIRKMLDNIDINVVTMEEIGIEIDIEETGSTFEENAIIKAEAVKNFIIENKENLSSFIILADDSGLEIDALDKMPGIYSSRYLGEDTPYEEKNKQILDKIKDEENRTARFVCAIALAKDNMDTVVVRGTVEGNIGYVARGNNGFGYDPIFYVGEKSFAEIEPEEKNKVSHRSMALNKIKQEIEKLL
ncbi:non-canonical purine NTP pyrophosphatase, RdgB/HAM1 family [Candidatus Epulonipiscium fishelsonii]|uniref:Non-canonical purine NTP pyrophosphatase, RdgB/HAM1 family n=1 Tax=Candidatus Epulonipiscium fishelsonii TaxID=77094 RepID=A0ACC8X7L6_9FIRM|nr:non-canonical purine NTP pyrophosphatase, RdgB/HAM1 family [Epulopiscium sp. SCG-B11WGA-EpuloA1]ONI41324.1 non-canonical purine NTP pyrophosphatase, RdgB/HAM1 family [Epulopiscium sp. SCG-B05WGA-EpuloA1]